LEEIAKTKMIKKEEMSVRLKKGMWGYETKKVDVDLNLSREEQLNVREKMIKDKHCW
jgi:flagellar assembly factor FliW